MWYVHAAYSNAARIRHVQIPKWPRTNGLNVLRSKRLPYKSIHTRNVSSNNTRHESTSMLSQTNVETGVSFDIEFNGLQTVIQKKDTHDQSNDSTTGSKTKQHNPTLTRLRSYGFGLLQRFFLPQGYPESVGSTYATYTCWHTASSMFATVGSVLSMQSMLYAVGLGVGAIPVAAAANWVLKDGIGQLGGVMFASLVNTRFDTNPKRWRFASALMLDSACLLEALTPLFPGFFLPIAAVANIGKNVGWLSSSATRAGFHQALALRGNLSDVTARAGSQSIAASTIGTGIGAALAPMVGTDPVLIVPVFLMFSAMNISCLYKALSGVSLPTLSAYRSELAFFQVATYLSSRDTTVHTNVTDSADANIYDKLLLDADQVSKLEPILGKYGECIRSTPAHTISGYSYLAHQLQQTFPGYVGSTSTKKLAKLLSCIRIRFNPSLDRVDSKSLHHSFTQMSQAEPKNSHCQKHQRRSRRFVRHGYEPKIAEIQDCNLNYIVTLSPAIPNTNKMSFHDLLSEHNRDSSNSKAPLVHIDVLCSTESDWQDMNVALFHATIVKAMLVEKLMNSDMQHQRSNVQIQDSKQDISDIDHILNTAEFISKQHGSGVIQSAEEKGWWVGEPYSANESPWRLNLGTK